MGTVGRSLKAVIIKIGCRFIKMLKMAFDINPFRHGAGERGRLGSVALKKGGKCWKM